MLKYIVANMKVVNNADSCEYFCSTPPVSEKIVYLTAIPLVLNGLFYLLVFVIGSCRVGQVRAMPEHLRR